jgi:glycosyltransferase involved in cell wall biosynthesis
VYPPEHRHLASFANGDANELRERLAELLGLPPEEHARLREAARRAAVERWSWAHVADRLLKAL